MPITPQHQLLSTSHRQLPLTQDNGPLLPQPLMRQQHTANINANIRSDIHGDKLTARQAAAVAARRSCVCDA